VLRILWSECKRRAVGCVTRLAGHKKPKPKTEAEITGTETEIQANSVFGHHIGLANQVTEIFLYCSVVSSVRPKRPKRPTISAHLAHLDFC
jgi:hypothetical protein